jgi:predicted HTH transcriptional regulator
MPSREELESALGKRWKELAKSEGHVAAVPKRFVGAENDSDARADTLLRLMTKRPGATMRTLSAQLNTTIDDTRRRMANLIRRGDVRYVNQKYEVTK